MLDDVIRPSLCANQASESDCFLVDLNTFTASFEVTFKLVNVASEASSISFSEPFDRLGLYKVERRTGRLESGAPESSEDLLKAGIVERMGS